MKKILAIILAFAALCSNAESYGKNGIGKRDLTDNSTKSFARSRPSKAKNYNTAAEQRILNEISKLEKQIALNEKKIAENAKIENKTGFKGTTSFSTRNKQLQNIKLRTKLIKEKENLRKLKMK